MSAVLAKEARAANKAKAHRLAAPHTGRVDASTWTPCEPLNAEVKTGLRPISKQHLKVGGAACGVRADRKPRKSGGRACKEGGGEVDKSAMDNVVKGLKADQRPGKEPDADDVYSSSEAKRVEDGRKRGGRAKREQGGKAPSDFHKKNPGGTRPTGGREARATGGRTHHDKGKTNVNIMIAAGGRHPAGPMPGAAPMGPPPAGPMPGAGGPMPGGAPGAMPHPGGMPGAGPQVMPMPIPMPMPQPQGGPPMMGRKAGGRVYRSYKDMDAGAGSGLGREEKADVAKSKKRRG